MGPLTKENIPRIPANAVGIAIRQTKMSSPISIVWRLQSVRGIEVWQNQSKAFQSWYFYHKMQLSIDTSSALKLN